MFVELRWALIIMREGEVQSSKPDQRAENSSQGGKRRPDPSHSQFVHRCLIETKLWKT